MLSGILKQLGARWKAKDLKFTYRHCNHKPLFVRENQEGYHPQAVVPSCHLGPFLGMITTSFRREGLWVTPAWHSNCVPHGWLLHMNLCIAVRCLMVVPRRGRNSLFILFGIYIHSLFSSQTITPSPKRQANAFQMRC